MTASHRRIFYDIFIGVSVIILLGNNIYGGSIMPLQTFNEIATASSSLLSGNTGTDWATLSTLPTTLSSVISSSSSEGSASLSNKDARLLKYFQKYSYSPPASRYDYIAYPAKECGAGSDFEIFFKQQTSKTRSSRNEDKFIYETFFKQYYAKPNFTSGVDIVPPSEGTYIEMGAYDGLQESNTVFFDKCLGWNGLLVEGNPENYLKVVSNRPHAHSMKLAPSCSQEYEDENHTIPFYRFPMTNAGLIGHAKTYAGKPTVDVPCGPLTPILADIFDGYESINFFSLDVEGAESLILNTIEWDKIPRIDVMIIEIKNNHCQDDSCQVRQDVRRIMKHAGYMRYQDLVRASDIYIHPNSTYQMPKSIRSTPNE